MKLGVLSDIHDNIPALSAALHALSDCELLFCCGDLCSPFIIDQLARGFWRPIHIVFGNNDADLFRITAKQRIYPQVILHGEMCELNIEGRRIAMNHFNQIGLALVQGQQYDTVFFGHNHTQQVEMIGRTLALNPGCVFGFRFDEETRPIACASTVAIYDTSNNSAELLELKVPQ
jgi:uncharacterized protein